MIELLKRTTRIVEAAATPRRSRVRFADRDLRFVRSIWWHDAHQPSFDAEIVPYFDALTAGRAFTRVCDAGAATGLFAVAACVRFAGARVDAFEPSVRQRLLLRRNLHLNGLSPRVTIVPSGLWNEPGVMEFRTHGAISSFRAVTSLPAALAFSERVPVTTLDHWARQAGVAGIDLLKMDIEGAEIEALEGAIATLRRDRPELLIQAYHLRDGVRTFDRCARLLQDLGYTVREAPATPGLLHARHA